MNVQSGQSNWQTGQTQESSKTDEIKQSAQETASKAVSDIKETGGAAVHEAKQSLGELASQTKQQAAELTEQAKQQAGEKIEEQKVQASQRLEHVASALRETGRKLHEQDEDAFAQYADSLAGQVEKASIYLQEMSISDMAHEVQHFAQRKPEMFLLGSLAAGFLVGRFLRSSSEAANPAANSSQRENYIGMNRTDYGAGYGPAGYPLAERTWPGEYEQSPYGQGSTFS